MDIRKTLTTTLFTVLFVLAGCSSDGASVATGADGSEADGNEGEESGGTPVVVTMPQSVGLYQTGYSLVRTQSVLTDPDAVSGAGVEYSYNNEENTISRSNTPRLDIIHTYDELGRVVKIDNQVSAPTLIEYNDDGSIRLATRNNQGNGSDTVTFSYLDGKLINKTTKSYVLDYGWVIDEIDYIYSEDGRLLRTQHILPESDQISIHRLEFVLDDMDRVVEALQYSLSDEVIFRHTVNFDANGNITNQSRYAADGALISSVEYTYEVSSELTPNMAGYQAMVSGSFLPGFNW